MSNINKSHSKLHTRLSFGVGRIAVNMFYTVFVRFASVNLCGLYCEGCSPDSPRDSGLSPPLSYTKLKAFESLSSEKTSSATYTSCHTSSTGHAIFLFHGLRHNLLLAIALTGSGISFSTIKEISRSSRHYAEPLHAMLHCLYVRCTIRHYAEPFHATLHCLYVRCTIRHYAEPFHTTLHCFYVRCTIRHYAEPFPAALHHMCVRCTILNYAESFDATLHRLCVRCAIRRYFWW